MTGSCPHLLAEQFSLSQGMPALPPAREFLTSAGFGGLAALVAAAVVAVVLVFAARNSAQRHQMLAEQQERHRGEVRQDELRAARLRECRERLAWVVDKGGIEPAANEGATVGFGPELALTVLQGIHDDAQKLDDATLAKAAAVQLSQLSRVLAKQSGAPANFGAVDAAATDAAPAAPPESNGALDGEAGASEDSNAPTPRVRASGRRRRQ